MREPEWSVRDIALLLAAREHEPVNSLGIPLADALNIANEFKWIPPEAPTIDWSLKARDDAMDKYYKQYPDMSRNGHMWRPPTLKSDGR